MKIIGSFLYYLLVSVIALIGLGVIAAHIFTPQLQKQFLKALEPYINADFEVGYIEASLFENFPYASVELKQVTIGETLDSSNSNAYEVGSIYALFNFNDLLTGHWGIEKLVVNNALINMKTLPNGQTNFEFWPSDSTSAEESQIAFDLDVIEVNNCQYTLDNQMNGFLFSSLIKTGTFSVHLVEGKTEIDVKASFDIKDLRSGDLVILKNKNLDSELGFTIQEGDLYSITAGKLVVEGMKFQVDGTIDNSTEYVTTDLDLVGTQTELKDLIGLSPGLLQGSLNDYKIEGGAFFSAKVRGPWLPTKSAGMLIGFGVRDGSIAQSSSGLAFTQINLEGSFSNGVGRTNSSTTLSLRNISARDGDNEIKGQFEMVNLDDPKLDFDLKAKLNLERIHQLFALPGIEKIQGLVDGDIAFKGLLRDLENVETIGNSTISADVDVSKALFLLEDDKSAWNIDKGHLNFEKPYLMLNNVQGSKAKTDFIVDGYAKNLFAFLAGKERLSLMLDVASNQVDLNDFLYEEEIHDSTQNLFVDAEVEHWPDFLLLSANLNVNSFVWDDILAKQVKGNISYSPSHLGFKNLELITMGGRMTIDGALNEVLPLGYDVVASIKTDSVDISTFFLDLDNFGQDYITNKHLKGQLAAHINCAFDTDANFEMVSRSLVADADVTLVGGELIGFLPMVKVGKFIKVGHFEHIVLDTLQNHLFIKNETIEIPQMDIHSNTIDMVISGNHTFENEMDYHMKVNVKKLFMNRHKLSPANFVKFENDNVGGMNVFLLVKGPGDDPEISYDLMAAGENMGQGVKNQLSELEKARKLEFEMRKSKQDSMTIYHKTLQQKRRKNAFKSALSK
ncbi:MAG: AsmA family protein [Bacteroidetes bacterium]|nr:AsmA family protein [Bacteroidota bacterium]